MSCHVMSCHVMSCHVMSCPMSHWQWPHWPKSPVTVCYRNCPKAKIRKPRRAKKRINNLPDIIDQINLSVYILLWNPTSKWSYWWYLHFRLSCFINKLDPLLFFVCWGPMITNTLSRPTLKSSTGKPVCWQNIETSLFTCTCFRIIPSWLGVIHILRNHG